MVQLKVLLQFEINNSDNSLNLFSYNVELSWNVFGHSSQTIYF